MAGADILKFDAIALEVSSLSLTRLRISLLLGSAMA
jgi:hypothetical protein